LTLARVWLLADVRFARSIVEQARWSVAGDDESEERGLCLATFLKLLLGFTRVPCRSVVPGLPFRVVPPGGLVPPDPLKEIAIDGSLAAAAAAAAAATSDPYPDVCVVPSFSRYSSSCCADKISRNRSVRTNLGT
jgi:hypothetical protein